MKTSILPLKTILAALAICLTLTTSQAQFAVSTGFDTNSGKYGFAEKTTIFTWHATAEYTYEAWSARVDVPRERVTSPVGTIVIAGRPRLQNRINARNQGLTQTESGLGDVEGSISFDACHGSQTGWSAVLTGNVKFATADEEKGLGTGKTDYGFAFDLSRTIDRLTPSIGFGYHIVGKPTGSDLKNYATGSIGLGYWLTDSTNLNLSFDCYQRSSASSNVDNELSLGLNQHLAKHWDIEAHALVGLSQSAPDYGAGASVRFSF